MEYTALYRKFRPLTFDEMVGQEHIIKTLRNEIMAGRVGHAYLFNGGRGTGKTTAAKILARAVNCLHPENGEPCNKCEICKAALDGSLTDIVEMDAASNNSVEDIRSIRDEVNFLPTIAKYRVYIIDEVHMLSTGAFNALLKTLEEPPSHVKFILATTEPQKLPATILSRCQRFDFKKLSNEYIIKRLNIVCKESNIDITPDAVATIAILAEGGMRDALSILERCAQEEGKITQEVVKELVGIPTLSSVNKLAKEILSKNAQEALVTIAEVLDSGKDIENFIWELTKYIKDILVFQANGSLELYSVEEKEQLKELAGMANKEKLVSIIYELSELANQIKWSAQKLIMFQVTIIKLCNTEILGTQNNNPATQEVNINNNEIIELKNKINYLEKQIKLIESTAGTKPTATIQNERKSEPRVTQARVNSTIKQTKENPIVGEKVENWPQVVNNIKQSGKMLVYTNLLNSNAIQINDMTVGINFPKGLTPFGKTILEQTENMNEIVKQVSIELGKPMRVKLIEDEVQIKEPGTSQIDNLSKELDIPINVIDD